MATLTIPITVEQIQALARQLTPQERQALIDALLAERFDMVLSDSDKRRAQDPAVDDAAIQSEVNSVRAHRREDRRRAPGG